MKDNVGHLCIVHGSIESSSALDNMEIVTEDIVYEVIRIIDRVPLFMEDHYARLKNSLKLIGYGLDIPEQELVGQIQKLLDASELENCNIKLVVYQEGGAQKYLIYISSSYYPTRAEVEKGIETSLFHLERKNPNVKLVNNDYKEQVSRIMDENKVFEVLLVNHHGIVTEGSKSNAFFIKGTKVYTAPGGLVLKGITRQHIIEVCERLGFTVVEEGIDVQSLQKMDGLFISGTSIKVLPVAKVNGIAFNSSVHPTTVAIRNGFDRLVEEYVMKRKG